MFKFMRRYATQTGFLTSERYPNIKRGDYGRITEENIKEFESILGPDRVITDPGEVAPYNSDWINTVRGDSKVVLKPKCTQEVSEIIKKCDRDRIAVCPQGGNTGLVGGSVPVFDEVVLSLSLMNKIYKIDTLGGTVVCDSGCILEKLDNTLQEHGLMMPLDLGAKGSCQIGGNISTSAGGLRLLRYGTMQANTLGLEVVQANGEVLNLINTLRKDNTGYHLRQLYIGSEGTLGIITKAVVQCPVRPKSIHLAFLGLSDYDCVLKTYAEARNKLQETLSSCEMIDSTSMRSVLKLGLKPPFSECPFYMVVETHGSSEEHDSAKMSSFLEECMAKGHIIDGTFSNEPSHMHNLWQLRERITESMSKTGSYLFKYDLTLPLDKFYSITDAMKDRLKKFQNRVQIAGFGHLGDGNIHLNVICDEYDPEIENKIEPFVFEWTSRAGGSVSAEHGIGFKKAKYLHYSKSGEAILLMKKLKNLMDPKGILNPYKVLI